MPPVRFANYIGNGVKGIYRDLCPDATQEKLEEAVRYQLEWYPEHCTEQTCFYPGMWETLQWMAAKGIRLVIVTNKVETTAKKQTISAVTFLLKKSGEMIRIAP